MTFTNALTMKVLISLILIHPLKRAPGFFDNPQKYLYKKLEAHFAFEEGIIKSETNKK